MMIQAIIFDLDGLLVDSEPYWEEARLQLAAEVGGPWTLDDQKAVMGSSSSGWSQYIIRRMKLDLSPRQVEERIIGMMLDYYRQRIPYLPGAVEAVDLATRHYPTGLASGSQRRLLEVVLNDPPLRDKFQVVVSADGMPRGKPAPDVYLEASRRMQIEPACCVCLEDSQNGILAGKAAGMRVIAVPDARFSPPDEILRQADAVLKSLKDFSIDLVQELDMQ
jgi:HAD superfamily hydrolase (TIGR01509 family)